MDNLQRIVTGIIEISKLNRSESFTNNKIIIDGSKSGFFSSKRIQVTIEKSEHDEAAYVSVNDNGKIISEDILKEIIIDILERTGQFDSKMQLKWDLLFNNRKIEFRNGEAFLT